MILALTLLVPALVVAVDLSAQLEAAAPNLSNCTYPCFQSLPLSESLVAKCEDDFGCLCKAPEFRVEAYGCTTINLCNSLESGRAVTALTEMCNILAPEAPWDVQAITRSFAATTIPGLVTSATGVTPVKPSSSVSVTDAPSGSGLPASEGSASHAGVHHSGSHSGSGSGSAPIPTSSDKSSSGASTLASSVLLGFGWLVAVFLIR